jgi:BirA family transcriptional regulator, biotin operon repressor / biotin---[acetyl-CoA-carboxylase] ligase
MFDLARIVAANLVARIDYHESLGSTSDRALELAALGEAELPLLVLAERQTAGRGRGSNRWWTSEGALTFSLVLHAPAELLPIERWPHVALIAGIAVCDGLAELAPRADLRLKWPNDVFLAGRKLGGILSESAPGWRDRLVVGIGVNVNNREQEPRVRGQGTGDRAQDFRPPTSDHSPTHHSPLAPHHDPGLSAVSLIEHDNLPRDLTSVLLAVLDHLERRWESLLRGEQALLTAAYRERCFLTGKVVTIEQPGGKRVVGVCQGIDDTGRLLLHGERGAAAVASGTVVGWDGGG